MYFISVFITFRNDFRLCLLLQIVPLDVNTDSKFSEAYLLTHPLRENYFCVSTLHKATELKFWQVMHRFLRWLWWGLFCFDFFFFPNTLVLRKRAGVKASTVEFGKAVHGHAWRSGDKLEEADPLFGVHQEDDLQGRRDKTLKYNRNILIASCHSSVTLK